MNYKKYQKMYHPIPLEDRQWPNNEITHAPFGAVLTFVTVISTYSPMTTEEKIGIFQIPCKAWF